MRHRLVKFTAVYAVLFSLIFSLSPGFLIRAKAVGIQNEISLDAKGAILMDMQTGRVLYQKNADERFYPASTTKILTALLALENGNLEDNITVGKEASMVPRDSSKASLRAGEQIKLIDLLMGLMLPSGNDAAMTIAVYVGRRVSNNASLCETQAIDIFVKLMNEKAKKLGANESNFVNPHGYHHNNHYTTPYNLALISRKAMENEFFKEIVSTSRYYVKNDYIIDSGQARQSTGHSWRNTNRLIDKSSMYYYEYATGIKTGFTTPAGHCIVSSASKDGLGLIAVVLNSTYQAKWEDPKKLLCYGFDNFIYYKEALKNQIVSTLYVSNPSLGSPINLIAVPDEDFAGTFNKQDVSRIQKTIVWYKNLISLLPGRDDRIKLLSSIDSNQVIGKMVFTLDGKIIKEINLKAAKGVKMLEVVIKSPPAVKDEDADGMVNPIAIVILGLLSCTAGILTLSRKALM